MQDCKIRGMGPGIGSLRIRGNEGGAIGFTRAAFDHPGLSVVALLSWPITD